MIDYIMLPQYHFVYGLVVSLVLYFGFDVGALGCLIFLVATVGIDVDHYLYYVYRKRDWSLGNAIRWFMNQKKKLDKMDRKTRGEYYSGWYFLHGFESILVFGLFGFFWNGFWFLVFGFI